jgi:hypothetical protein
MSDDERCDFVRTHLSVVVSAAKTQLREGDPAAESISIGTGQLGGGTRERRRVERRKTERRKPQSGDAPRVLGDRRVRDRRKSDRRKKPSGRS